MRKSISVALAALLIGIAASSWAKENNRYSTWSDPSVQSGATAVNTDAHLKDLIKRLNKLIDEAEKARAADPAFLRDLRALADGATSPWNSVVLDDAFSDGNFTANPSWQVLSGEYFIEQGWGLRNRILNTPTETQSSNTTGNTNEELAIAILGTILKRATNAPEPVATAVENVIITRVPISNAFQLSAEVASLVDNGHFEIGVFQGDAARAGYRLLYVSGQGLQIHRVGNSGSAVVDTSSKSLKLEDKKYHTIVWSRDTDGKMTVSVDGESVISVTDRGFADPFNGVRVSNRSGDFILKRITAVGL